MMARITHNLLRERAKDASTLTGTTILTCKSNGSYYISVKHEGSNWEKSPQFTTRECLIYLAAFVGGWELRDTQINP